MLDLYNSCCKILPKQNCEYDRKKFISDNLERDIEFRAIETSTNYRRNVLSFAISKKFNFSIGYLLDTKYFYIVKDSSMVADRIELDKVDEINKTSDIEKVLIHGRIVTDKELAIRLLFDDETDDGFIEMVNYIKGMKV